MDAFQRAVVPHADRYAAARAYVSGQPFRATARLLYAVVPGRGVVSNEPEALGLRDAGEAGAASRAEAAQARALLDAPPGRATRPFPDVGDLRLLVRTAGGVRFGVGEPLQNVHRAQEGIGRAFVLAGGLALVAALALAAALSYGLTRPLRRMAAVADRVDGGDLAPRMDAHGPRDELRHLATAFDTMLDRLQDAFDRQAAFVADASHELRTPLTVIRGQLEVLARDPDPSPEDVRHVSALVTTEVQRMSRMVDDLLVLAAPTVHLRDVELAPFVAELVDVARATLPDRELELGPVTRVTVRADPDRLAQAVRNLVRNAAEHTAPGGHVRVSASAGARTVTLAVDDDGPGIPPAERDRVFDRFHRLRGTGHKSGGAGLGLSIVRAIAEAHGGRAAAAASDLGGARMTVELPRG